MDPVAVITGAAKPNGIGAACARGLAADGFRIVAADIGVRGVASQFEPDERPERSDLQDLVEQLEQAGHGASSVTADVSTEEGSAAIIARAMSLYGRVDVLVNNAAAPHGDEHADLDRVPVDAWDRVMAINSRGMFLMSRAAFAVMREQRSGRIVSISSVAGRVGLARTGAYGASKAAIIGLTRSMAVDAAPFGITANAVCPGFIDTNRIASSVRRSRPGHEDEALADLVRRVPAGRLGRPDEVAAAVRFFASDAASYITAQVLTVDGGAYPS
ncbi:MAG: 3-oxoacyl-[acyl-carrier protein] reductase [Acidimicrobiaceae bacterium]|nr:3-oxoacyl-[acyl-carrier protein] reductase [Acidimicrobiaceae bacterium]